MAACDVVVPPLVATFITVRSWDEDGGLETGYVGRPHWWGLATCIVLDSCRLSDSSCVRKKRQRQKKGSLRAYKDLTLTTSWCPSAADAVAAPAVAICRTEAQAADLGASTHSTRDSLPCTVCRHAFFGRV